MRGQSKVQFFGRAGLDVGVQIEEVCGGLKIDFSVVRVHLVLFICLDCRFAFVPFLGKNGKRRTRRRGTKFNVWNLVGAWEVLMD